MVCSDSHAAAVMSSLRKRVLHRSKGPVVGNGSNEVAAERKRQTAAHGGTRLLDTKK